MTTFLPKSQSILLAVNLKWDNNMMRIITFLFFLMPLSLLAQTNTWIGANGGTWNTTTNWSLGAVPTAAHDVVFNTSRTVSVNISPTVKSITVSNASTVILEPGVAAPTITINTAGVGLSIASGGTLTLNGSNQGGGRSLTVTSTSTSSSIAGTLNVTNTGNGTSFSSTGTFSISGTVNCSGGLITFSSTNTTITSTGILNCTAGTVNLTSASINNTGTINCSGGTVNLTSSTLNVSGTLNYTIGTLTTTSASISFGSGGTYIHGVNGGAIPAATWNANSTCRLTGITTTAPTGLNQNFGHFTYNCAGHSSGVINFNSQLTSIAGNFTVLNAGSKQGSRTLNGLSLASTTDATINIGGNLVIDNSGTEASWLIMTTGDADLTMNIGGNFTMANSGGSAFVYFDYKWGTGTVMGNLVVNVAGNLDISGGANLDMGFQALSASSPAELRLSGNLVASGNLPLITSALNVPNGKIIFAKNGLQTFQEAVALSVRYIDFQVNSGSTTEFLSNLFLWEFSPSYPAKSGDFVVQTGATLDLNTFTIQNYRFDLSTNASLGFASSFVLNSGAHLITARSFGVHVLNFTGGAVSAAIANRTFSSGANYTYDGTVLQRTGTFVTTPVANTVNNLTVNNSAGIATTGVTVQQHFNVNGTLNLQQGHFTTFLDSLITINSGAIVVGGSDNSFVNGPMKKIGSSNFTFPIGKLQVANAYNPSGFAGGWRPFGISNLGSTATDGYTAEFFLNDANLIGVVNSPGIPQLLRVSPCEYWGLRRDATNSLTNISATLYWKPKSDCNAGFYISNPAGVTAALSTNGAPLVHNRLNPWDKHSGFGSGTATDGSVTYSNIDYNFISSPFATAVTYRDFTPFAIGSVNISQAPLPVELRTFTVTSKDKLVHLDWLVNDNDLVKNYTIERSRDGKQFESLSKISAIANLEMASYNDKDLLPFSGWSYYRLKITDHEGKDFYSSVQKVWVSQSGSWLQVSPKPAKDRLMVNLAAPERISELSIVNNMGQLMMRETNIKSLNQLDISTLRPGMYYLRVIGKDGMVTDNFIKQ
jgi:hypothetical protein